MWRRPFPIILLTAVTMLPALASARPFPLQTKRGTMSPAHYPEIVIDGATRHLSPGARIWSADNLIEMPASLRGSNFVVNYTIDEQGEIDRVWILSGEEAEQPLKQQINSLTR